MAYDPAFLPKPTEADWVEIFKTELTVSEAAKFLGVDEQSVRRLIRAGRVLVQKAGGSGQQLVTIGAIVKAGLRVPAERVFQGSVIEKATPARVVHVPGGICTEKAIPGGRCREE